MSQTHPHPSISPVHSTVLGHGQIDVVRTLSDTSISQASNHSNDHQPRTFGAQQGHLPHPHSHSQVYNPGAASAESQQAPHAYATQSYPQPYPNQLPPYPLQANSEHQTANLGLNQAAFPLSAAPPVNSGKSSSSYPAVMVYPPPPPLPLNTNTDKVSPTHAESHHVQLPSMGSWAPRPHDEPLHFNHQHSNSGERNVSNGKRRPSDAEEVEAGMALANMAQVKKSPSKDESSRNNKRVKKEESGPNVSGKKVEKDNRKSCSECRRLKAKCDRVFPCSNCRRRGCALVCPDGDLSCMQGKRLVLASTEQLHERIAQLEAALSQSHSKTNASLHPLLAPQYLDGGFVSNPPPPIDETLQNIKPSLSPPALVKPSADELSPKGRSSASSYTLLTPTPIMSSDRSNSQGRMAVESLLLDGDKAAPEGKREDEWVGENAAPAMIVGNCGQTMNADAEEHQKVIDRLKKILRILPPREETRRRANSFWEASQWYNTILKREEFENIYEPAVYAPTPTNPLSPHKLACVLMVLTLDTYFDLKFEEDNPSIAEYWDGAQQCFDTRFGWAASVAGVQALALATLFVGFGWRGAKASNFYWLRLMTSAAQQLGLHKDPHHSLPEDERDFRRRVFWDCYTVDCLMSINHGQRSAIQLENIETLFPSGGNMPVHLKKYEYMRTVKASVIDIGCRPDSAPASWEQINATHQILMQYDLKESGHMHCSILVDGVVPPVAQDPNNMEVLAMFKATTSMCHFKAMMFLYRPSLRQLIARLRAAPNEQVVFSEQDRQTVTMTYRACHAITQTSLFMSRTHPRLSARCWAVWVQTFSAAVSMAALAIWCGPHLEQNFIASAYAELTKACDMIRENGSKRSQGVLSLLPILQSLVRNRYPQIVGGDAGSRKISVEGEDMLFALLGGQVDQRGVSPQQGNLMNPPFVAPAQHLSNGAQHTSQPPTSSPVEQTSQYKQAPPASQLQHQPQQGQVEASKQYTPVTSNYSTQSSTPVWNPDMMALPVVNPQPSASPLGPFSFQYPPGPNNDERSRPMIDMNFDINSAIGFDDGSGNGMNHDNLWARLQTFYEPTPAYWGQSVGSVPNGYVDYNGMNMGMGMGM